MMSTLAIESTCDDTSVALVSRTLSGDIVVHYMLTFTQTIHGTHGGVVPELASRDHSTWLPKVISYLGLVRKGDVLFAKPSQESDVESGIQIYIAPEFDEEIVLSIDSISIASHPGLPGSLVSGITAAYMLSHQYDIPIVEVNHIMGHVFSILLDRNMSILKLPYLCLTVSGGHSDIYLIENGTIATSQDEGVVESFIWHKRKHLGVGQGLNVGPYRVTKLVQTMDDAVGEAFDKVAKMLGGPYPGGRWIDELARIWEVENRNKSIGNIDENFIEQRLRKLDVSGQFSFSGIKAQVSSLLQYYKRHETAITDELISAIARRFQDRVTTALIEKTEIILTSHDVLTLGIVGGVSKSKFLREKMNDLTSIHGLTDHTFATKSMRYCVDNAAMIGIVGLIMWSDQQENGIN